MNVTPIAAALVVLVAAPFTQAIPARPGAAGHTPQPARTTAAAPQARAVTLSCAVGTPPGSPVTFTPPVTLVPARVTARGALWLSGCRGRPSRLRSGWVRLRATGQVSCAAARDVRGSAAITWYDASGRPVGSSRLRVGGGDLGPGGALLTGRVTGGPLDGRRSRGGVTAEAGVLGCAMTGIADMPGTGRISFD
jgi:hypothetical protein